LCEEEEQEDANLLDERDENERAHKFSELVGFAFPTSSERVLHDNSFLKGENPFALLRGGKALCCRQQTMDEVIVKRGTQKTGKGWQRIVHFLSDFRLFNF